MHLEPKKLGKRDRREDAFSCGVEEGMGMAEPSDWIGLLNEEEPSFRV